MEAIVALLAELNDLKRQSTPHTDSLAAALFQRAWALLIRGQDPAQAALTVTAQAVASARLGGIDRHTLREAGLDESAIADILERSFQTVSEPIDPELRKALCATINGQEDGAEEDTVPPFIGLLMKQPRAGATRPGRARVMLLPAESHADHCAMVAIYSVLLSPRFGADPGKPFLAALFHHAHNALLADAGFTGEEMLGEHLEPVIRSLRSKAAAQIPEPLRRQMQDAFEETGEIRTPEAKAFHAADVIDRVLQMRWYETAAQFKLRVAMEEMELVHAGPVQSFHYDVLREAGLW